MLDVEIAPYGSSQVGIFGSPRQCRIAGKMILSSLLLCDNLHYKILENYKYLL